MLTSFSLKSRSLACWISRSGYHAICLRPEEIPKSAFISPVSLFEYRVLPFGLCNALAVFTRYMTRVLSPMLGKSVVVYLDNILVLSKTPAEHLVHLEQLFTLLQENKLFAKASKCTLNKDSTEYLEYLGKVATDCPAKLAAVSNWPRPENPKATAVSLTTLCANTAPKGKKALEDAYNPNSWTQEHMEVFHAIKHGLRNAPTLALPDPSKPTVFC